MREPIDGTSPLFGPVASDLGHPLPHTQTSQTRKRARFLGRAVGASALMSAVLGSMSAQHEASAESDAELITQLQRLLKKPRGSDPERDRVALALRLVRDPTLESGATFWKNAGVAKGSARMTIKDYRDRIISQGMLVTASHSAPPSESIHGLDKQLMLTSQWIQENAASLVDFRAGLLSISPCGRYATRSIEAWNILCDEQVHGEIVYGLPPAYGEDEAARKQRRMVHRHREEAALRALDGVAASEHRAKRAKHRHDEREQVDEVLAVVERLVSAVERKAAREQLSWQCPHGCIPGAGYCARWQFRLQCVPDELCQEISDEEAEAGVTSAELREDFLLTWDGILEPERHWEPELSRLTTEFLGFDGKAPEHDQFGDGKPIVGSLACARQGCTGCCYCRHQPPLPVRLAVREFLPSGCTYTREMNPGFGNQRDVIIVDNHPHFGVFTDRAAEAHLPRSLCSGDDLTYPNKYPYRRAWITLDELRDWIKLRSSGAVCALPDNDERNRQFHSILPHYLLDRPGYGARATGGILCVPGAVRALVASTELQAWESSLSDCSMQLVVLQDESIHHSPSDAERHQIAVLLNEYAATIAAREAWLVQQQAEKDEQRRLEQQREAEQERDFRRQQGDKLAPLNGMQLSCSHSRHNRSLRPGDFVWAARDAPMYMRNRVAIVGSLESISDYDGSRIFSGLCHLQVWNPMRKAFCDGRRNVEVRHFCLTPSCCGQISCPNLQTHYRLPAQIQEELLSAYRKLDRIRYPRPKRKSIEEVDKGQSDFDASDLEWETSTGMHAEAKCGSDSDVPICEDGPDSNVDENV